MKTFRADMTFKELYESKLRFLEESHASIKDDTKTKARLMEQIIELKEKISYL